MVEKCVKRWVAPYEEVEESEWNWETHPNSVAMHTGMAALREQLAAVTKERDEIRAAYADEVTYNNALRNQVAELEKQRDELVAALENIAEYGNPIAKAALAKLGADKTATYAESKANCRKTAHGGID